MGLTRREALSSIAAVGGDKAVKADGAVGVGLIGWKTGMNDPMILSWSTRVPLPRAGRPSCIRGR